MFPVKFPGSNGLSMGYDSQRNLDIVLKIPVMRTIIAFIEERVNHDITNVFGRHYQNKSYLRIHNDKELYQYRWIFNFGCTGKKFHLKCKDMEIALAVEHGTVIILHTLGGGPSAKLQHGAFGDPSGSFIIVVDTSEKTS